MTETELAALCAAITPPDEAARAASSGGVMAAQRAASSVSVMVSPICFRRSGKTLRQGRARPV